MRTFHTGGVAGGDITQGLPRVEELFEARRPKKMAQLAEISGEVRVGNVHKGTLVSVDVVGDDGDTRSYMLPHAQLLVKDGERIEKGRQMVPGALYPQDVLRIQGIHALHEYRVKEVLKPYRSQGVDIHDKHIEVICRQMMRKVRVEEAGDSKLLSGSTINVTAFEDACNEVRARIEAGERHEDGSELILPTATQLLLGITKAALATDSFLSAASFQETTKVLTEAAINGKVDQLEGLKENVIIGKLIPAGTGLEEFRQEDEYEEDEPVAEEEQAPQSAEPVDTESAFDETEEVVLTEEYVQEELDAESTDTEE
jgi:DNA-directed RNA polymerase subunit beta'